MNRVRSPGWGSSTYGNDQRGPTCERVVGVNQDIGVFGADTDHVFARSTVRWRRD